MKGTVSGYDVDAKLAEIQALWDREFARFMTQPTKDAFPKALKTIGESYHRGDRETAARMAHEHYAWALRMSESCEVSGPGWNYFNMFRAFGALEERIRAAA